MSLDPENNPQSSGRISVALIVGVLIGVAMVFIGVTAYALGRDANKATDSSSAHAQMNPHMTGAAMVGDDVPAPGGPNDLDDLTYPPDVQPTDGKVREYTLEVTQEDIEVAEGVKYAAWTFNGTVPGPTLRATEGDTIRITLINRTDHPHSAHLHGIHAADQDGVFEMIQPGEKFTYEMVAAPAGVQVFHCHAMPLKKHIAKGLYGTLIIDPKKPREKAKEIVMMMNGFDTDGDASNNFYTANGKAFYYAKYPIKVKQGELVRVYLANMTEFDLINSFHLHGNFYRYYPTGSTTNFQYTDMITQAQGERGIVETRFPHTGTFMFHAHQSEFADLGWMGYFQVEPDGKTPKGKPNAEAMAFQQASSDINQPVTLAGGLEAPNSNLSNYGN